MELSKHYVRWAIFILNLRFRFPDINVHVPLISKLYKIDFLTVTV